MREGKEGVSAFPPPFVFGAARNDGFLIDGCLDSDDALSVLLACVEASVVALEEGWREGGREGGRKGG